MTVQGAQGGLQLNKSSKSPRLEHTRRILLRGSPQESGVTHSAGPSLCLMLEIRNMIFFFSPQGKKPCSNDSGVTISA